MKNKLLNKIVLIALILLHPSIQYSQIIANPSFEGIPQENVPPDGWSSCHEFSTPDTQPGFWEVTKVASSGNTYTGLVTRGNLGPFANQNEDIQSQLSTPLTIGNSYDFSIDLSLSENWGHFIGFGSTFLKYDTPAQLQIFGGANSCESVELLWESPIIDHLEWISYPFTINPQISDVNYLILSASHSDNSTYFGNILIDNISIDFCPFAIPIDIQPFDTLICEMDSLIIDVSTSGGVYQWNTGSTEPSILVTSSGIFTVDISNGCDNEVLEFMVDEKECNCEISAPNVFTPNGDGINETFEISGTSDIARFNLRIFNRTGIQVYRTDIISNYWNGNLNGKELPSGVYYWAVDIQCINGNSILDNFYKGWVTILR